jgi:hypothetical protein
MVVSVEMVSFADGVAEALASVLAVSSRVVEAVLTMATDDAPSGSG